ncbi:hypothetical protein IEQ44_04205 [Nocardioides sp. Y6]|uniref:Uncharacterized protein n=1 Tax=Nocardioides malaquae TaxID=2773426 RepID=A0ABR9RQK3_9ACTN|nr:hypothetical protein [Nocardioides malaquae]MBE7323851.1 hypothetical protein [Nocardioides malaquae]
MDQPSAEPGHEPAPPATGVHLERVEEHGAAVDALAGALGGRADLTDLVGDLKFTATESRWGRLAGRAVRRAIALDPHDQRDRVWWPQGVTTSADADPSGRVAGRRLVVLTWYAKAVDGVRRGSRLTFFDLDTLRYRHVLLVEPRLDDEGRLGLESVRIHAGGIVWAGGWLHVAATARGFLSFRVDDLLRVPDDNARPDEIGVSDLDGVPRVASFGHHYVLPVRTVHRARTDEGHEPLRYSFLSLDRSTSPPSLLAGEYARGRQSARLAHFDLDPTSWLPVTDERSVARPVVEDARTLQMQGAVVARGRHHVTTSRGPWLPGSVRTGRPDRLRAHHFAVPMGPEDLTYVPQTDALWTVTEHPRRRWLVEMRRSWFD